MHFCTFIVSRRNEENLEEIMNPYFEGLKVEPYKDYVEHIETQYWFYVKKKLIERFNCDIETIYPECKFVDEYTIEESVEKVLSLLKTYNFTGTIDEFMGGDFDTVIKETAYNWCGNVMNKDENGWYEMTSYNPNSKWDWYEIGGRWAGNFTLKQGVDVNKYELPNFSWGWDEESRQKILNEHKVDYAFKTDILNFEDIIPHDFYIDGVWYSKDDYYEHNKIIKDGRQSWDFDKIDKEWEEFVKTKIHPMINDDDMIYSVDIHI